MDCSGQVSRQQTNPASIKPTIGGREDKITRCVLWKVSVWGHIPFCVCVCVCSQGLGERGVWK